MKSGEVLKNTCAVGLATFESQSAYEEAWASLLDDQRQTPDPVLLPQQLPDALPTDCKYKYNPAQTKKTARHNHKLNKMVVVLKRPSFALFHYAVKVN